jgi:hypothetical protein
MMIYQLFKGHACCGAKLVVFPNFGRADWELPAKDIFEATID